jgi:geranylgeranyl diphosphate synthase type II
MAYSLLAPGKRIRPRILLAVADLLELPRTVALPAAVAVEMVHCFTLIHDDLPCLDNDDLRRGRPSNHKQFGESTALLAGDALSALAFGLMTEAPANTCLSRALVRVIAGQDAESLLSPQSRREDLLAVHRDKTGALFEACVELPAILSHTPLTPALRAFGLTLGATFQAVDDLEDAAQDTGDRLSLSLLRFDSPDQIRAEVQRSIQETSEALSAQYGPGAEPLLQILEGIEERAVPTLP